MGELFGWIELPEHLRDHVLARLPLDSVFRLRSVNRGWKLLLSSNYFLRAWTEASGRHPLLMLCMPKTHMRCLLYSFASRSWQTLLLSFTEEKGCVNYKGSAAGLLLVEIPTFSSLGNSCARVCVCNPLNRKCFPLPEMAAYVTTVMARGIVAGGDTYRVVVLCKSRSNSFLVQIYDSAARSWKIITADLPNGLAVRNGDMVFCKGHFFCMTVRPAGILCCNPEDEEAGGRFKVLPLPVADGSNVWPRLLACGSKVLLAEAVEENDVLKSVVIWEFCDNNWKEIARMPSLLCEAFERSSCSNWFECVGVGEMVCFRAHGSIEVLVYSLARRSWAWLPSCPAKHGNRKHLLLKSLSFEPRPLMEV